MSATFDRAIDRAMLAKAEVLIEALPYFQRYAGRTFVVKYGGHAMGDPRAARDFAEDIVLLRAVGINPVVVHGGGLQIGAMLKKLGVESTFVDGLRVTDKATAEIAEMVLSGAINKELVGWIAGAGGKAIGISGKDGGLVTAEKVSRTTRDPDSNIEMAIDLGFVGEPSQVDTSVIDTVVAAGMIPVVAPIGAGADGHTYNINADTIAGGDHPAPWPLLQRPPAHKGAGRAPGPSFARRYRRLAAGRDDFRRDDSQARNLREGG